MTRNGSSDGPMCNGKSWRADSAAIRPVGLGTPRGAPRHPVLMWQPLHREPERVGPTACRYLVNEA
jgi:hypothetical protein